jgi:hypothetical protein
MFKWLKKWFWNIWIDNPVKEDKSMYLSHEERIEILKERVRGSNK